MVPKGLPDLNGNNDILGLRTTLTKTWCFEDIALKLKNGIILVYQRSDLSTRGFSNWKNAIKKFQIHEGSDCHNDTKQMKILAGTNEPIDEQSNTKLADQKKK